MPERDLKIYPQIPCEFAKKMLRVILDMQIIRVALALLIRPQTKYDRWKARRKMPVKNVTKNATKNTTENVMKKPTGKHVKLMLAVTVATISLAGSGCKGVVASSDWVSNGAGGLYNPTTGGQLIPDGNAYLDSITSALIYPTGSGFYDSSNGYTYDANLDGYIYSQGTQGADDTKDVDLQRADLQNAKLDDRAASIQQKFGMSFESAHQLAILTDQVATLRSRGNVSSDDVRAVSQTALGIAGISSDEVNSAITQSLQGDESGVNQLMEKAAQNLGMSSSATLRDQLLPALGIQQ